MEIRQDTIYSWLNQQIKAHKILCKEIPLSEDEPWDTICVAGVTESKGIHVYPILTLAKLIGEKCEKAPFSDENDEYYFMYNGYKFYGLVSKEEKK